MLPDVEVTLSDSPAARVAAPSSANWFTAGTSEKGVANTPVLVRSTAIFEQIFGVRQTDSPLWDSLDVFFREGGVNAYVSRIVGPAAAAASGQILDAVPAATLDVDAISPGAWGNDLEVVVTVPGPGFVLTVELDDVVVETSPELADNAAAVAWAANSDYIRITDLGGAIPAAGTTALANGTDDRANVTGDELDAALDAFSPDYGEGQVALPGFTTATAHASLLAHAHARHRTPLLDLPNTAVVNDLTAPSTALRTVDGHRVAGPFAPWDVAPGLASGTTRTIPPSARNAALHARALAEGYTTGEPVAGVKLPARYVQGLSQPAWSDADREALNDAGVNVSRVIAGQVVTYGNRTATSAVSEPLWAQLNQTRVVAAIGARSHGIGQRFAHSKLDGKGFRLGEFLGELRALCLEYLDAGDLFGASAEEAFEITPASEITDASATLLATIELAASPGADRVEIQVVKTPTI